MKLLVVVLLITLFGCGQETQQEPVVRQWSWSGNISEQSEHFVISYDEEKLSNQIERIESWWVDIQECAGVSVDISGWPLSIEYIDADFLEPNIGGIIDYDFRTAFVIQKDLSTEWMGRITRHEMLHYLLFVIKVPLDQNDSHSHPFFESCKDIIS